MRYRSRYRRRSSRVVHRRRRGSARAQRIGWRL